MDPDAGAPLDPRLRAWVEAELPGADGWTRLDEATQAQAGPRVFAVTARGGQAWVVKQHRSARAFAQERRALTEWWPSPAQLGGVRIPRIRAAHPGLAAVLVERLPGRRLTEADLEDESVHRAAGRFLASLHALPIPDADPLPPAEAVAQRLSAWRRRVSLDPAQAEIVAAHGPVPGLFAQAARAPCHRDFAPRNWLWDGTRLAVVDFEHARLDLPLVDLTKLEVDLWGARPGLRQAFFAGYGRELTAREQLQLRALIVVHGLASLAWGQHHGVEAHLQEGRRALERAAQGPSGCATVRVS